MTGMTQSNKNYSSNRKSQVVLKCYYFPDEKWRFGLHFLHVYLIFNTLGPVFILVEVVLFKVIQTRQKAHA